MRQKACLGLRSGKDNGGRIVPGPEIFLRVTRMETNRLALDGRNFVK